MKKELFEALTGDEELVSLVGRTELTNEPCIFFNTPTGHNSFPVVSFFEKDGADSVFADDCCIARTVVMQIDIWSHQNLSQICGRVEVIMRSLGYSRISDCDLPDPNIGHRQSVYQKYCYN
ncbi:MAG: hypothetical protein BWY15_01088 [Firmicutes bacterium ADurb.Bin193]|nr:MAG: hypothetical protein BWY15_01088 [Firmicutes bacterium ADurb.Bin193]